MNEILKLLNEEHPLICGVFWKKSYTKGIEELNNSKTVIGKKFAKEKVKWILEIEENALSPIGILPNGEVVSIDDNQELSPIADELYMTPFIIFMYQLDDDISVNNISKTYSKNGMSKYLNQMLQYTQWCRLNNYDINNYDILLSIEKNITEAINI